MSRSPSGVGTPIHRAEQATRDFMDHTATTKLASDNRGDFIATIYEGHSVMDEQLGFFFRENRKADAGPRLMLICTGIMENP